MVFLLLSLPTSKISILCANVSWNLRLSICMPNAFSLESNNYRLVAHSKEPSDFFAHELHTGSGSGSSFS